MMFRSFILGLGAITLTVLILYGLQIGVALSGWRFALHPTVADEAIIANPNAELGRWWQDTEYETNPNRIEKARLAAQDDANHLFSTINAIASKDLGFGASVSYIAASKYSDVPGICERKRFALRPLREWTEYSVVGSFVSPPYFYKHQTRKYVMWENRIKADCALRKPSAAWFFANSGKTDEGHMATAGAILFDGVIAAARSTNSLPFTLDCSEARGAPTSVCNDPRAWLSKYDPAVITHITKQEHSIATLLYDDTIVEVPGSVKITIRQCCNLAFVTHVTIQAINPPMH